MENKFKYVVIFFAMLVSLQAWAGCDNPLSPSSNEWKKLRRLNKGLDIQIDLKNGESLVGRVQKLHDGKLIVKTNTFEQFCETDVQQIRYVDKTDIGKSMLIGAGLALGAAYTTGIILESGYPGEDKGMLTALMSVYSIPIGAGLGILHGLQHSGKIVVAYKAPTVEKPDLSWYQLPKLEDYRTRE